MVKVSLPATNKNHWNINGWKMNFLLGCYLTFGDGTSNVIRTNHCNFLEPNLHVNLVRATLCVATGLTTLAMDVKGRTQAELQCLPADFERMWLKWLAHLYTYIYRERDVHIILRYISIHTNNSTPDFCVPFRLKTPQLHLCLGGLVGARSPGALTPKLHLRCRGEFHPFTTMMVESDD